MSLYSKSGLPSPQGLYHPANEHDACGVGCVADIGGVRSHNIIEDGLSILENLTHRGAAGADPATGDGAGILIQTPDEFLRKVNDFELPPEGEYACANLFLPKESGAAQECKKLFVEAMEKCGLKVLGWRKLETDVSSLGEDSSAAEPVVEQVIVGMGKIEKAQFDIILFRARKLAKKMVEAGVKMQGHDDFYVCSLFSRTMVYKGMFLSHQLALYYPELHDEAMKTAVALVHQRFSTNTFPSWKLAHPYRFIAHNGEFNTIQGNINMIRARENMMECPELGKEGIQDIKPVIGEGLSDTASFDNALELFLMTGRSLPHVLSMMVPEAWSGRKYMDKYKKDFYLYHANLLEPWDGPATICATDGKVVAAALDRNGLRPARFWITKDNRMIFASEAGVLPVPESEIKYKSRLWPGKLIVVDMEKGTFCEDEEVKQSFFTEKPYDEWLKGLTHTSELPDPVHPPKRLKRDLKHFQKAFGYTEEEIRHSIEAMAINGQEPVGSMGADIPFAVLSKKPKHLFRYFHQKFAQVTNPAIDPIREECVMSLTNFFGASWNVFKDGPEYCNQIQLDQPILTNYELEKLAQADHEGMKGTTLNMLFEASEGKEGLEKALEELFAEAEKKIDEGYNILILSDRNMSEEKAAMPCLLALSGLHHHLVRCGKRGQCGLIVETGEARLVHHFAVLFGYGANGINPYLAFETLREMHDRGELPNMDGNLDGDDEDVISIYDRNYIKAINKGILKVMSKMGISTLMSYRGAQIFEAIGLSTEFINKYFPGTVSNIEGAGLEEICAEALQRHDNGFGFQPDINRELEWGGDHRWRPDGEYHLFNPETVALLQHSVRNGDYDTYKKYANLVNDQSRQLATIRGILKFKQLREPIPLEEVEPVEAIVKRFCTGAMSLGSISSEAHETLAIAMNRIGGKSNTGEGGEDVRRFKPDPNGDRRRSAIKQVASGRFGVTTNYLVNADELQIKVCQGAKPGEGGQLPGHKVSKYIAGVRHSIPGVTLISPPPHHDIYSIEDLAQLIYDLKNVNPKADIAVKLASETGVGTVAAGVAKAHAEVVIVAGYDGGTGASPISSIRHTGTSWEFGLAETHQTLVMNKLRSRIRVQTDGQMKTGRDVLIAAMLGAEEYGFATAALVAMGCVIMRKCHLGTCPVGIATQDEKLRKYFKGQPAHVVNFMLFVANEVRELMASLGIRTLNEAIGQREFLEADKSKLTGKAKNVDLSKILAPVKPTQGEAVFCVRTQDHGLEDILDIKLIEAAKPAIEKGEKVEAEFEIHNYNRTTGTMLSGMIAQKYGDQGLPDGTIKLKFRGIAGQSFGTFLVPGVEIELWGEANDYVGKGMSGGTIVIRKDPDSTLESDKNWIVGNTLLYGATGGRVFISGRAGERFGVRNSGCVAVVEGVGDHGCEYMTGGLIVVLGDTGINFASGMSGGIALVRDADRKFSRRCNMGMVDIEHLEEDDFNILKDLIREHSERTGSKLAGEMLENWQEESRKFVKIMPREYRRVLAELEEKEKKEKTEGKGV